MYQLALTLLVGLWVYATTDARDQVLAGLIAAATCVTVIGALRETIREGVMQGIKGARKSSTQPNTFEGPVDS